MLISRASTSLMSPSLPTVAGLPPFNNFFAARSFRALQLRAGPLQSLVDLANRVAPRWLRRGCQPQSLVSTLSTPEPIPYYYFCIV